MSKHDDLVLQELSASYHLDDHLTPRDNSVFRISGIGQCARQVYYRIKNYREGKPELPIWTHAKTIFETGSALHLFMQHRFGNCGTLRWVDADPVILPGGHFGWDGNFEITFWNEKYGLKGHCDALTRPLKRVKREFEGQWVEVMEVADEDDPDADRYIIDWKTMTAREKIREDRCPETGTLTRLDTYPSTFEKLFRMKDEHRLQASLYAWLTTQSGFQTSRIAGPLAKIPKIMIIYVAKDLDPKYYGRYVDYPHPQGYLNAPFKVFTETVDQAEVDTALLKVQKVWNALKAGKPPTRDYRWYPSRPNYHCTDCAFRHECYEKEGYFVDEQGVPIDLPPTPLRLEYQRAIELPRLLELAEIAVD